MRTQTATEISLSDAVQVSRLSRSRAESTADTCADEALVERIADGDREAMRILYGRHNVRVYRFLLRFTENATAAEDLLSDVFLEVWRSAERFEKKSQVSTWLLAIARYKALSALRRRPQESLDAAEAIADPADDPEVTAHKQHRSVLIRKCLSQLSPVHREVIDLVYYHDKSVEEVARIVQSPVNTVKTRMFHARAKLAGMLKEAGLIDCNS